MSRRQRDWNELKLSEDPAVELLQSLGYAYAEPEQLEAERESPKLVVLERRLAAALRKLNPWLSDDNVEKAIKEVARATFISLAEANEKLYTALTYGIALEQDRGDGRKSHSVRFFDFDNATNNELLVTRQYKVKGSKKHIYPDVVVFVNGVPVVVIECKSPTLGEKWRDQAIKQVTRYQEATDRFRGEGAPKLFETVQLVIGCCGQGATYGTVGTPTRFWSEWKEPYPLSHDQLSEAIGRTPTPQDVTLYGLLKPDNLLDLIRNFVVFDTENGRTVRKVCRYKQFMAVNKAIERIKSASRPDKRGGVVWHTQGSGKSLTMLWLALKLRRDPQLENPTLVMVTDRVDLDRQLCDTFVRCGFPNPERAGSVKHLKELLSSPGGKAITTTVQKFQEGTPAAGSGAPAKRTARREYPLLSAAENIFVMVDEAHRTQYRGLAANLRKALPNACFLGFTGTPIDKKDRSTAETFGPYIDTYTIEQAVRDGATVPIFYESRLPELSIQEKRLDTLFERVFGDRSDEEKAEIKKKYATEQAIAAAPERIEAICLDIIKHFESAIQPNGFKAQVVAASRDMAVQYQEALERLNAPPSVLIMSVGHNDEARFTKYGLSKEQRDKFINDFKDSSSSPKILVVCDMLLTGFDAPVEQVMYLDSPLKEHTLLQAIARTNRTAERKTYGLVVDYWGISESLQEALAIFSPSDVAGAMEPKEDELPRLQTRHQAVMRFFIAVKDRDDLSACVGALAAEDTRSEFDQAFKRFSQSMDMLLPDKRALPYIDDLRWLGKIRMAAKARYRDEAALDISDCGAKVRELIDKAVSAGDIQLLVKQVSLFSKEFDKKLDSLREPEAKASEMEHAIRHEITVKLDENPAFYSSLRERLEELVETRKQRRIDAAEQLGLFQSLVDELRGVGNQAEALGLSETGYAIYGLLQASHDDSTAGAAQAEHSEESQELAETIESIVAPRTELVDWWQKDDVVRRMRRDIKRVLRGNMDDEALDRYAADIVDLMKRRKGH